MSQLWYGSSMSQHLAEWHHSLALLRRHTGSGHDHIPPACLPPSLPSHEGSVPTQQRGRALEGTVGVAHSELPLLERRRASFSALNLGERRAVVTCLVGSGESLGAWKV